MTSSRRCLLRLCALAAALGCTSLPARAQQVAPNERDYEAVVLDATREFEAGRFEEARALFVRANELRPSARTLRGLGFTEFELRHYAAAHRTLSASLTDPRNPLTPEQRAQVEPLLVRIREFVGRYRMTLDPPSAHLTIDGEAASLEPDGTLWLDAGARTVVASAPGYETQTRHLDVVGGEEKSLQLALLTNPGSAAEPDSPSRADARSSTLLPWLLVGGGGAVAVTGVVLFAIGRSKAADVTDAEDGTSYASIRDAQDDAPVLSNAGIALAAAGLVGAGVGVALLIHASGEREPPAAAILIEPGRVRVQGAF